MDHTYVFLQKHLVVWSSQTAQQMGSKSRIWKSDLYEDIDTVLSLDREQNSPFLSLADSHYLAGRGYRWTNRYCDNFCVCVHLGVCISLFYLLSLPLKKVRVSCLI